MLHYTPAVGLPCSPLRMWCGTLGLGRHGFFKPLKCPSVLSSVTRCHGTLQSTDRLWGSSSSWRKGHCWHPFLNLLFLPPCGHCCGLLCLPKAMPFSLPLLNPRGPKGKGANGLRMQCGQCRTAFSQSKLSGTQHNCCLGLVLKYCLRYWKIADGVLHITVNKRNY